MSQHNFTSVPYIDPHVVQDDINLLLPIIRAAVHLVVGSRGDVFLKVLEGLAANDKLLFSVVDAINAFTGSKPSA